MIKGAVWNQYTLSPSNLNKILWQEEKSNSKRLMKEKKSEYKRLEMEKNVSQESKTIWLNVRRSMNWETEGAPGELRNKHGKIETKLKRCSQSLSRLPKKLNLLRNQKRKRWML